MEVTGSQQFKNVYTQRFHDFFYFKLKNKEIDTDDFYDSMGVSPSNRYSFFSQMRSGRNGATAEHIKVALDKYGVRPDYLFGASEQIINAEAPKVARIKDLVGDIKKIKEVLDSLESKILNR